MNVVVGAGHILSRRTELAEVEGEGTPPLQFHTVSLINVFNAVPSRVMPSRMVSGAE